MYDTHARTHTLYKQEHLIVIKEKLCVDTGFQDKRK